MNALKNNLGCGFGVGLPHGHDRKQENTFFVFSKSKSTTRKNCNQFFKKVKSSQVNIFILDFCLFYLLELSNYKQTKQKKINEEVCPQIEKKVQEPPSQLT